MLLTDQSQAARERILKHRLPDLDLGGGSLHPHYDGLSILNLPSSICTWLGAPALAHPALDLPGIQDLAAGVDQVITVLIDALSLHRFQEWFASRSGADESRLNGAFLSTVTSVVPSTTSAALTTLWTGRSPAEHGILGYELFLKEFGLIANMITHSPAAFDGASGLLYQAGFDPQTFLPVEPIGPHLKQHGIESHAFLHYSISGSGLSQMHYPDVHVHRFAGVPDLWIAVRQLAEQPLRSKRYLWVYYGGVDGLSHRYGPDSEQARAEFLALIHSLEHEFLGQLEPAVGRRTLLLMLADHGQLTTRKDPHYELVSHPDLSRRLVMVPTGENRLAYLYPKPGQVEAVGEYLERTWAGSFRVLPSSHALDAGLFGPGEPGAAVIDRLGERVVVGLNDAYLWWAPKENPLIGRHGGVSEHEMLVPLFMHRLG
ncbi:MAG: alkaline phosphatase family protein [Anaerolineales bacterium]|jgi:hypothetical protein